MKIVILKTTFGGYHVQFFYGILYQKKEFIYIVKMYLIDYLTFVCDFVCYNVTFIFDTTYHQGALYILDCLIRLLILHSYYKLAQM